MIIFIAHVPIQETYMGPKGIPMVLNGVLMGPNCVSSAPGPK